jgi:hypothetical protein
LERLDGMGRNKWTDCVGTSGRIERNRQVGAISPHGRLKYWYQFQEKHKEVFDMTPEEKMALDIPYLDATEAFNFSTLKHYSELVVDEIRTNKVTDKVKIHEIVNSLFKELANRKDEKNPLLIWQRNVIREGFSYDTRPAHSDGDFDDFGHFNIQCHWRTKEHFQKEFVKLYRNLQEPDITLDLARGIRDTITTYCDDFRLQEDLTEHCKERFYNIMTPFYDDVEDAINNRAKDQEAKDELILCKKALKRLIYGRNMIAT